MVASTAGRTGKYCRPCRQAIEPLAKSTAPTYATGHQTEDEPGPLEDRRRQEADHERPHEERGNDLAPAQRARVLDQRPYLPASVLRSTGSTGRPATRAGGTRSRCAG